MSRKKGGNALGEFGARQNELNFQLIQTVSDLKEYCRELEERLEKETDARHKNGGGSFCNEKRNLIQCACGLR